VAKYPADEIDVDGTEAFLRQHGLEHLRVRRRGDTLTLVSGPENDPIAHARLRKVSSQWWTLEMPTHTGRWDKTGLRAPRLDVLTALVEQFPWTLTPIA
jgi:hypothetical protein